jgi:hypothetical protein
MNKEKIKQKLRAAERAIEELEEAICEPGGEKLQVRHARFNFHADAEEVGFPYSIVQQETEYYYNNRDIKKIVAFWRECGADV